MLVVHAPSNCMVAYASSEARGRARTAPVVEPPVPLASTTRFGTRWYFPDADEPPLPIDDSDGGCDCEHPCDNVDGIVWSRQSDLIPIDHARDAVTEDGGELYNLLASRGVSRVLVCGVHLNMCVIGRGFGIRQLRALRLTPVLLRDLTDSMYNSRSPPHVAHDAGTELVVQHVERHLCASAASSDLVRSARSQA